MARDASTARCLLAFSTGYSSLAQSLRRLRCDQMQGYLYSKPVPFDALTVLLEKSMSKAA